MLLFKTHGPSHELMINPSKVNPKNNKVKFSITKHHGLKYG